MILAAPLAIAASCTSSSGAAAPKAGSPAGAATTHVSAAHTWPMYHRSPGRSGVAAASAKPPLKPLWRANLDGSVYGETLFVGGLVIVATENDTVYGLKPGNGHVVWRRHLGQPQTQAELDCGNINPLGITGTPAYDVATGSVFVVAETEGAHHTLWAINASNGHRRWHRSMDVVRSRDRRAEQQRSALLVAHGRVFTAYGGLAGDCSNYIGYITSTPTTGNGKTTHYAVPSTREAGMWSPAGPVRGANGNVYVAAGNGEVVNGKFDKSDSVTELNPVTMHRIGVFAPSVWRQDNSADADLGSSSPVPVHAVKRMVISGKNGHVYLLKPNHLGGVGGDIASITGCSAYGGGAVRGHTVLMPCDGGVRALHVGRHSMHWRWSAGGVYGSPIIVGHTAAVADSNSGQLRVLAMKTGHQRASISLGQLPRFSSAMAVGDLITVGTLTGVTAVRGS
jgi:outer membrane protein assembly factor BamB